MKRGRKPTLFCPNSSEFVALVRGGQHTIGALAVRYNVGRKTLLRWLDEMGLPPPSSKVDALPLEEWRAVIGWEGFYEVSNMGRVRSLDRVSKGVRVMGRLMKPYPDNKVSPYAMLTLHSGGRKGTPGARLEFPMVHKLVLEAFVGPRPEGKEACHDNGNGMDNRLTNLRWDTHKANMADQFRHGTKNVKKPRPRKWKPGCRGRVPRWYTEQQIKEL